MFVIWLFNQIKPPNPMAAKKKQSKEIARKVTKSTKAKKAATKKAASKKVTRKLTVDTIYFQMLPGHRSFDI